MKRIKMRPVVCAGGIVLALLLAAPLAVRLIHQPTSRAAQTQARYYCPMHPTYISDHPGDCPICFMKMVKLEERGDSAQTGLTSICYLHNCPKVHEGKPCPMTVVAKPGEKVVCPICGAHIAEAAPTQQRKVLYWTDPMIPGYKSDKPGQSPMGMDLVPVYEEEAGASMTTSATPEGYAPVLLTPQKQQLIGVKTAPAMRRRLVKTIRTVGRVAYDPELYQAQQEYLQALESVRRAESNLRPDIRQQSEQLVQSSHLRLRLLGMSEALIEEMGGWSGPDQSLLLADPERHVWVYANVYEYELPLVSVGQTVRIELPSILGKSLEGTVQSIDPVLDPQSRSARVRVALRDPEGVLKPEMFVNVFIGVDAGEALAIPHEAIFATGERYLVFVDNGQGLFEPRDVIVGVSAGGYDAITQGLEEGEQVVTSGNFLIDSESRLKAAIQGAAEPGHQHGQ